MINQILQILALQKQADICEISERIQQAWNVASYGLKKLVESGLIEPLPITHPTYKITTRGLMVLK